MTVWVVVEDAYKAVGLWLPPVLVPALVAGCASDPQRVEDLLAAADSFAGGLAAMVADSLVAQSQQLGGHLAPNRSVRIAEAYPRKAVGELLGRTGEEGLIYIDLNEQVLVVHGRAVQMVHKRGELEVTQESRPIGHRISYQLGPRWRVEAHREV